MRKLKEDAEKIQQFMDDRNAKIEESLNKRE